MLHQSSTVPAQEVFIEKRRNRLRWAVSGVAAMVALILIAQLAVLGPARRASLVPPAVATRTV